MENNNYSHETNSFNYSTGFYFDELLSMGVSIETIKLYIREPMKYNQQLRKISRQMYNLNGLYANVIDYMVAIPSLDVIVLPRINTKKNFKNRKVINHLMKKINHKLTTRDMLFNCLVDGMYVGILRDTKSQSNKKSFKDTDLISPDKIEGLSFKDNLMIQPLNKDYIKVIGFQNNDYVVAFDMSYFNQYKGNGLIGVIKNYPKEFYEGYKTYQKDASKRWFVLDQSTTIVLKFKSSVDEPYGRPLGIGALNDMVFDDEYIDSQRANLAENASTIRYLIQPEGEKAGSCSLNKDQQTAQYENFRKAIHNHANNRRIGKTSTVVFAPKTETGKLETDNSLLRDTLTDENIRRISTNLGFASSALNGSEGASYSSLQVNIDLILTQIFQLLEQVQWQYTKIFNHLIGNKEDVIDIVYLKTSNLNKTKELENAKDLYVNTGGSRLWYYAVATGDVDSYMSLMEYEKEMNFAEKFPPHPTSYNIKGDSEGGRPSNDDSDNPNTIKTKTNGGNDTPKPSN